MDPTRPPDKESTGELEIATSMQVPNEKDTSDELRKKLQELIRSAPSTEFLNEVLAVALRERGMGLEAVRLGASLIGGENSDELAAKAELNEAVMADDQDGEFAGDDQDGEFEGFDQDGQYAFGSDESEAEVPQLKQQQTLQSLASESHTVDKVQFLMSTYYVSEADGSVSLQVLRLGKRAELGRVRFHTEDGTARQGEKYEAKEGVLEFQPGEQQKDIVINLQQEDIWQATMEFTVLLSEPDGVELVANLQRVRVKIVDDDTFPCKKFEKEMSTRATHTDLPHHFGVAKDKAKHWPVMREYFKMNFRIPVVKRGSIKLLLRDFALNLLAIGQMLLQIQLVDEILDNTALSAEDSLLPLTLIAVAFLMQTGVEHYLEYQSKFWKVGGASRKFLMANVLRRWLAYNLEYRNLVPTSMLTQAVGRSCVDLVSDGYMKVFPIVKGLTSMLVLFIFQVSTLGMVGAGPMLLIPCALYVFMKVREVPTRRILRAQHKAETELLSHLVRTADNVIVLTDFSKRASQVERFEGTIQEFNKSMVDADSTNVNNSVFSTWLGSWLVSVFIILGGYYLKSGASSLSFTMDTRSLGTFQAIVNVFKALAGSISNIYESLLTMLTAFPALEQIVTLLNLEVQDVGAVQGTKEAVQLMHDAWSHAQKRDFSDEFHAYLKAKKITRAMDTIPIKMQSVKICFWDKMYEFNLHIRQGELATILGSGSGHQHGPGKSCLLSLLAGWKMPDSGSVFLSPHLKVLHVPLESLFFARRTLLQNLCLGLRDGEHQEAKGRVTACLKRLGFGEKMLDELDSPDGSWLKLCSMRDKHLLSLTRALVASPDVLLVHCPLFVHSLRRRRRILQIFREYVDQRGFLESPSKFKLRNPCTCIFSSVDLHPWETAMLDRQLEVKDGTLLDVSNTAKQPEASAEATTVSL
mmetsp:Transcript_78576/g.138495  ORF Transcript_78576/g.138495 Transcript_78576/m.138495 type:complete len:922 (-) Transcript_78576:20-2785(-)